MPQLTQAPNPSPTARKRKSKQSKPTAKILLVLLCLLLVAGAVFLALRRATPHPRGEITNPKVAALAEAKPPSWVEQDILPLESNSRRGVYLEDFTGIVLHYIGNPMTTPEQNRKFYGNPDTEVNSHFIIGMDGAVLQCMPLEEKSSASNERNRDTISVEVCHPDETGVFTQESYESLLNLTVWLCQEGKLKTEDVIRHYDITGKLCPYDFVQRPEEWARFQEDLDKRLQEG